MKKCGFIGLGSQGGPMARRMIDAGFELVLWARRAESLESYAESGAKFAPSISALGTAVDYCAICVTDDAGVQQVFDELLPAMATGGCIVIHSTIHPDLCRRMAESAATRGISLLDAPVSGGGRGAADGNLTVMVGGDTHVLNSVRPIFESFASVISHLGGVGAGQVAKLVNNNLMAANLTVAHFALETAEHLGINREAFQSLVAVSSGRSFSFDVCARMATPTDFEHGAKLLAKDVGLLREVIGEDPSLQALQSVARNFLDLALAKQ